MVLGPSRWRDGTGTRREPAEAEQVETPLELRRRVARALDRIDVEALLLEDQPPKDPEDHFRLFTTTIRDRDVTTFLLVWPLGARLHGLDVEIGYLLARLEDATLGPDDIFLLAEHAVVGIDTGPSDTDRAVLAWSEPGNRTRYHQDLIARGCPIRRWSSVESLERHAVAVGLEHRRRHKTPQGNGNR